MTLTEISRECPNSSMAAFPEAAAQMGQLPNKRTATQLSLNERLGDALRLGKQTAEDKKQRLIANVIDRIAQFILSETAKLYLRKEGVLDIEFRLKGGCNHSCSPLICTLDDIEVPYDYDSDLKTALRQKIKPKSIQTFPQCIAKDATRSLNVVCAIKLDVSSCQENVRINSNGSIDIFNEPCHMHDENTGEEVQTALAKVEKEYRASYADLQIDNIIDFVFGNSDQSPICMLDNAIREGKIRSPKLKFVFNCTEDELNQCGPKDLNKSVKCFMQAKMQEIIKLLERIPVMTDITVQPQCGFIVTFQGGQLRYHDQLTVTRAEYPKMVAEYTLKGND